MADYGEWNRKGAVLSDVTAQEKAGVAGGAKSDPGSYEE
jgi:hypothetical protein